MFSWNISGEEDGRIQPHEIGDYEEACLDLLVMEDVVDDGKTFVVGQVDDDMWR